MASQGVPASAEVRALLARGSGRSFAATSPAAQDARLRPRVLPLPVSEATDRVMRSIGRLRGWRVVGQCDGVIQATRTTRLFRFVDDISILLEPAAGAPPSPRGAARGSGGATWARIVATWPSFGARSSSSNDAPR